jgi:PAS domain S-box-containing protein
MVEVRKRKIQTQSKKAVRKQNAIIKGVKRRQAEEALKESEGRCRTLMDNSLDAILMTAPDGSVYSANAAARQMFGMTEQELINSGLESVVDKSDPRFIPALDEQARTGKFKGELRLKRKDGTVFRAEISGGIYKDKNGQIRTAMIIHDITELKQAEESLQVSEEIHRALVANYTDAVVVSSGSGTIYTANAAALRMFGVTKEEFKRGGRDLVLDKSDPRLIPALEERIRTGHFKGEINFRRKDGTVFPSEVSSSLYTAKDGQPRAVLIIRDISERKRAEDALIKAKEDLEVIVKERTRKLVQANAKLKEFGHWITQVQEAERKRIAYELHDDTAQYLSILKMQLGALIRSGKINTPDLLERLRHLEKDADRAFNDVRRYSHELRPVVLEHLGLRSALEQIAEDTNIWDHFKVEVEVEGRERGLSEEIKLAFFRIAQEAVNNTRKHARADKAIISLKFQKKKLGMRVTDNGIGFDKRAVLSSSSSKSSLGLMSMRERADLIGATLKIESQPGLGTIISVEKAL